MSAGLGELLENNRIQRRKRTVFMLSIWGGIVGLVLLLMAAKIFRGDSCQYILTNDIGGPEISGSSTSAVCSEAAPGERSQHLRGGDRGGGWHARGGAARSAR